LVEGDLGGLFGLFCPVLGLYLRCGTVFGHFDLHSSHLMAVFLLDLATAHLDAALLA